MITDELTDTVYISTLLKLRFPELHQSISAILKGEHVDLIEIDYTKDIWCRDYMPVQVSSDKFIQFKCDPDYLRSKQYRNLRSEQSAIISALSLPTIESDLVIDGGNVVKAKDKVIMTDKIFKENKTRSQNDIIREILTILALEDVVIIPKLPGDFTGHSDGMVRFVNSNTVLLNDFSKFHPTYFQKLKKSLAVKGLNITLLPWYGWQNKSDTDDSGDYINFLHVGNVIIYPEFDPVIDESARKVIQRSFLGTKIYGVDGRLIAKEGGLLNCCTWNIQKRKN